MAKKNIVPTHEQAEAMKSAGIEFPFLWTVVSDYDHSFIIKHCITGEFKVIDKE